MSLLLFGGLFLIVLLLKKNWLIHFVSPSNNMVHRLPSYFRFEHAVWSGLFLFLINTLLFGTTVAVLFLLTNFSIPYLHLLMIVAAVLASLYTWISIYHADRKNRRNRLVMGMIGSSFYLLLFGYAVYRILVPVETSPIEQDSFMEFIAMLFLGIITFTAWIVCFGITGLYRKRNE